MLQRSHNMEIEAKLIRDGRWWVVDVPVLVAMTQGRTKKEAIYMTRDLVITMIETYFSKNDLKDFDVIVKEHENNILGISATDKNILLSLSLRRQREWSKSTIMDVAHRMGSNSPNSYAQYERGKIRISLDKYENLLQAINPTNPRQIRIS
jgi:hypothetical protein